MMRVWILTALMLLAGCSTISPAVVSKGYDLAALKTAYVVSSGKNIYGGRSFATYIQPALAEHGVTATFGSLENKPKEVDFYVTYVDRWQWDLAMYLSSLEITFFDNKTDRVIASGSFKNGIFHTYPSPSEKVKEVISSIYLK